MLQRYLRYILFVSFALAFAVPAAAIDRNPLLAVDASSPRATLQTFQTLAAEVENTVIAMRAAPSAASQAKIYRLMQKLGSLLDLSDIPPASRRDMGRDAIVFLVDVLRRIEVPPLESIPGDDQFPDVTKPASWTIPGTEITIGRVLSGPKAGKFVFDADTVARAGEFYSLVKNLPLKVPARISNWRMEQLQLHGWMIPSSLVEALPAALKVPVFDTPIWKILATVVLLSLMGVLIAIWGRVTKPSPVAHSPKSYLQRLLLPAGVLLAVFAASSMNAFQIITVGRVSNAIDFALAVVWYVAAAWAAWMLIFVIIESIIESPTIPDQSLDANLLRLLGRVLGILSVAGIVGYGAQEVGLPVVGVIAGLGVGGLAVALAAQSSIENLIGGLNLYADRPIRVGDFCDYAGIQGHVEHIGLRSTRIRALDRTVTSVPNSLLAKVHITNYALRDQMLFRHTLDLRYETTTAQLRDLANAITAYLDGHPKVVRNVSLPRVRVIGFGDWSMKMEIYAYVNATELPVFLIIQQELAIAIIDLVRQSGADFAFPSQTVYLTKDALASSG
ncbi:MAG TPA: mechanosensitive ion channel family protein [Hyphomicrobium sp.]|nr:mechanosensitive ion channel family protein [Hyphomicrobium sp.]